VIGLASPVSGTVVNITTNLYVRDDASLSGNIIALLPNGTGLTITGYTSDGWLQITSPAPAGFVSSQYVNVPVVSVSSDNSVTVTVGDTAQVGFAVFPGCATNLGVVWSSSNSAVASVDASGLVTGQAVGSAVLTVRTSQGGFTATTNVTVQPRAVTGVSLNKTSSSLLVGATETLQATVSPANATNQAVSFASSDASVVTVNSSGLVTAIGAGQATVTVTTSDGGFTASCDYTVTSTPVAATGVVLDKATLSMGVGHTAQLTATVSPASATNKAVTYVSSNPVVATVDPATGKVTAIKVGSATITVTTSDGGFTASCQVTVTAAPPPAASTLSISGGMKVPSPLKPGTAVTVKGVVSSNYKLTSVTAAIKTASGTQKYGKTVNPNAKSFNLNAWDNVLLFSKLTTPGEYVYLVSAKDESGASKTLVDQKFTVGTTVPVTGVSVAPVGVPVMSGRQQQLTGTVSPSNATDKGVTWSSSNSGTASVSTTGLVKGVVTGTGKSADVTVTVKTVSGGYTASSKFRVYTVQDVQARLNTLTCKDGNGKALVVDGIFGTNSTNALKAFQKVNKKSENGTPDGATLTLLFSTTAVKCGASATPTPPTSPTTPSTIAVTGVSVSPQGTPVMSGRSQQLSASVLPSNASDKRVSWSSSSTGTASVSTTGLVKGVVTGTGKSASVTVTVKTVSGSKTATSTFKVYTVQDVQTKLNALTCKGSNGSKLTVDGQFGANSTAAMKSFQKAVGTATKDGTPDGDSLRALFASGAPKCGTVAVPVTSVFVTKLNIRLNLGDTDQLSATVLPTNATIQTVTWESTNKNVVTVDSKGKVTTTGPGTASVIVTTTNGAKTASATYTVVITRLVLTTPTVIPKVNGMQSIAVNTKVNITDHVWSNSQLITVTVGFKSGGIWVNGNSRTIPYPGKDLVVQNLVDFSKLPSGTFAFSIQATDANGKSGTWDQIFEVQAKSTTIVIANGYQYLLSVPGLTVPSSKPNDQYRQGTYTKFKGSNGNVGCSATSMAIALSAISEQFVSPADQNKIPWNSLNMSLSSWVPGKVNQIADKNEALLKVYKNLAKGRPSVVRLGFDEKQSAHYVTIIGVKYGANPANLSESDFWIVDPTDGAQRWLRDVGAKDTKYNRIQTYKGTYQIITY